MFYCGKDEHGVFIKPFGCDKYYCPEHLLDVHSAQNQTRRLLAFLVELEHKLSRGE